MKPVIYLPHRVKLVKTQHRPSQHDDSKRGSTEQG